MHLAPVCQIPIWKSWVWAQSLPPRHPVVEFSVSFRLPSPKVQVPLQHGLEVDEQGISILPGKPVAQKFWATFNQLWATVA